MDVTEATVAGSASEALGAASCSTSICPRARAACRVEGEGEVDAGGCRPPSSPSSTPTVAGA
eukprot:scaffold3462_cov214-Prasinococcus_capsulatus_cf.AAC.2